MAFADAGFPEAGARNGIARWTLAGAVVLSLHAGVWVLLRQAPANVGTEQAPAIEMDLTPLPSGEAQMVEAGSDAASEASAESANEATPDEVEPVEDEAEELPELTTEDAPPPEDDQPVVAEAPTETTETVDADVTPAVALPPGETVVAQEERPEPRPEARKLEPKRQPTPRKPRPEREEARKPPVARPPAAASASARAGGSGGASSDAGAARAAAQDYGRRLNALIAAQKRYPAGANGAQGRAVITFTVSRNGQVVSQSITSSSGHAILDAELQAMLRRASGSFPAMPAEMSGSSKRFSVPMSFTFR